MLCGGLGENPVLPTAWKKGWFCCAFELPEQLFSGVQQTVKAVVLVDSVPTLLRELRLGL